MTAVHACADFERRFDAFLAGTLPMWEAQELRAHAAGCSRCGPLLRMAEGSEDARGYAPEDLTGRILAQTSGSPCASVEERLCDLADGLLSPSDEGLITDHLSHCRHCDALAGTVALLARELPELAEIDPGPAFARRVTQATARRSLAARSLRGRARLAWEGALRRPRFALELAFSGALVLTLMVELPGSPLENMPGQAVGLMRVSPSVVQGVERSVETAADAVPYIQEAWSEELSPLARRARDVSGGLFAALRVSGPVTTVVFQRGGAMLGSAIRGDLPRAAGEWNGIRREVSGLWQAARERHR
jgi:hypothetical protein